MRENVLIPIFGDVSLPVSGILLSVMTFLLTYIFIPRLGKNSRASYIKIGVIWFIATIIFEFALGFVTGESFKTMLQAYNILSGNLWLFIVIFIGFLPWLTVKVRKII